MTFPARPVMRPGVGAFAVLETNDPRTYWPEGRRYSHMRGCGFERRYRWRWISRDMRRIRAVMAENKVGGRA